MVQSCLKSNGGTGKQLYDVDPRDYGFLLRRNAIYDRIYKFSLVLRPELKLARHSGAKSPVASPFHGWERI